MKQRLFDPKECRAISSSWSLGSLRPLEAKIPTSTHRLTFTYSHIETVNSSFN